jgi:hypothetical protein
MWRNINISSSAKIMAKKSQQWRNNGEESVKNKKKYQRKWRQCGVIS